MRCEREGSLQSVSESAIATASDADGNAIIEIDDWAISDVLFNEHSGIDMWGGGNPVQLVEKAY